MLTLTIWISFLGALLIALIPAEKKTAIRMTALGTASASLLVGLYYYFHYDIAKAGFQFGFEAPWIPQIGASFHFGVDGFSLPLVLLTGIIAVTGILYSWNIEERVKEFFTLFLALIGGVYGVFQALDVFLLFLFYEIAIIPKYFIIAIWGSTRKEYGAMKLVLYSFVGSSMVFIGMLAMFFVSGAKTFDIVLLRQMSEAGVFSPDFQLWAFPLIFVGFGILGGLVPFHTWAPTGHVAAPTAASMLLAGVVMKLGAYGALRVGMYLMPEGLAAWKWPLALLAAVGIVYGALIAFVQKDFKFVIGYSSVSHMGFVVLGLVALNVVGLSGAVLQMFSHGILSGLLFAVVGRLVYYRWRTRVLADLGGLYKAIPFAAVVFFIAGFASAGLPGFSGFVAELQILIGSWEAFPVFAIMAGFGIVMTFVYILRTMHAAFLGDRESDAAKWKGLPPITLPEKAASIILLACSLIVGVYPGIMTNLIDSAAIPFIQTLFVQGSR
jgi:NADH-quinone oxidoreductase subunit M